MSLDAYHAATWKPAAPYVYHAATWKLATSVSAYEGGAWKIVAQILSAVAVTNDGPKANGATFTMGTTVTGGYGTLSYSWARTSFGAGAGNITGPTNGPTVDITGGTNAEAEFTVTVTDSATGASVPGIGNVTWGTPP